MSGGAPPAGDEELAARRRLDVVQVSDSGVVGVGAEAVLFVVGAAEDVVSKPLHGEDSDSARNSQLDGVNGEIASLEGVDERDPDEIAKGKHEAETVSRDVHGRQDGRLHPQRVKHVDGLECGDEENTVGDVPMKAILVCDESEIHQNPS